MPNKRTPEADRRYVYVALCIAMMFGAIGFLRWMMTGFGQDFGLGFALGMSCAGALAFTLSKTLREAD